MYAVIVGGGVVGLNVLRAVNSLGYEAVIIETSKNRYARLESDYEHMVVHGDGTDVAILAASGVERADLVIAVTGQDEVNIVVSQLAKELFRVPKCIARVNDPRNAEHFQ